VKTAIATVLQNRETCIGMEIASNLYHLSGREVKQPRLPFELDRCKSSQPAILLISMWSLGSINRVTKQHGHCKREQQAQNRAERGVLTLIKCLCAVMLPQCLLGAIY
jgi:hypothetical protein